jgi:hypothetical protein
MYILLWRKLTNDGGGKTERNSDGAYGTAFRV